MESDAFLGIIFNGDSDPQANGAACIGKQRHQLDSWENYLDIHVKWIDAGPSPTPTPGVVVQWFSFIAPPGQDIPSSVVVISSPSHVSNSVEPSDCESSPACRK